VRQAHAGLEALDAEQVKRLRLAACPLAAAAVVPRALRLLRRRLPGAELVLEEATAAATRDAVRDGRIDVGVWVSVGPCDEDPAIVEVVLHREPLQVALPADHPLTRLDRLDAEALAATPLIAGDARWRVESLRTQLALVAAGEGYALVPAPAAEPLPAGVALRELAGAPEWELRAARPAHDVLSVGTLAAIDALRTAASRERLSPPRTATLIAHA